MSRKDRSQPVLRWASSRPAAFYRGQSEPRGRALRGALKSGQACFWDENTTSGQGVSARVPRWLYLAMRSSCACSARACVSMLQYEIACAEEKFVRVWSVFRRRYRRCGRLFSPRHTFYHWCFDVDQRGTFCFWRCSPLLSQVFSTSTERERESKNKTKTETSSALAPQRTYSKPFCVAVLLFEGVSRCSLVHGSSPWVRCFLIPSSRLSRRGRREKSITWSCEASKLALRFRLQGSKSSLNKKA